MHEIVKYFILTEIQEQCLNPMPEPLIGPGRPAEQRIMHSRILDAFDAWHVVHGVGTSGVGPLLAPLTV